MPAVKICQGNTAPFWVPGQLPVLHLDMHDHVAGLLDLPDAAQIHFRAEPAHQRALYAKVAQVAAGVDARQDEENQRRAGQREQPKNGGDARQRAVKPDVILRDHSGGQRFLLGPPHLHADERGNGHQDKQ